MHLSVTTPRGSVVDTEVEDVTAPGALGELGVLPGHVPLMTALKPGVLTYRARDHVGRLAVGEGFLQVAAATDGGAAAHGGHGTPAGGAATSPDRVLVLVDHALPASSIDRALAERDLAKADAELAAWKHELDGRYQALVVSRAWAQARLDAAGTSPGHGH